MNPLQTTAGMKAITIVYAEPSTYTKVHGMHSQTCPFRPNTISIPLHCSVIPAMLKGCIFDPETRPYSKSTYLQDGNILCSNMLT